MHPFRPAKPSDLRGIPAKAGHSTWGFFWPGHRAFVFHLAGRDKYVENVVYSTDYARSKPRTKMNCQ